jgi:hypothetical protein
VANTLAYYDMTTITATKSFIVQAQEPTQVINPEVPRCMDKHTSLFCTIQQCFVVQIKFVLDDLFTNMQTLQLN